MANLEELRKLKQQVLYAHCRLIDAGCGLDAIYYKTYVDALESRVAELEQAQAEIVHCGECSHWGIERNFCRLGKGLSNANIDHDYCSFGVRKEVEG